MLFRSWGATLGGVLTANASGPRRRHFGGPRDRILGARFVTGDGVLARTGGRVVKNVAGHAVHRLLVGSHGALGVFVEASLKLPPQPPARLALVWGMDVVQLSDRTRWARWPRREPAVLTVLAAAPPPDAFRPPYAGSDKSIRFRERDLDYARLRRLAAVGIPPSFAEIAAQMQRVWLDQIGRAHV